MAKLFADLHIHSCLSPCGDDDMTPCNIGGMAKIKGLDIIAVTDHNTARNLPAVQEVCDAYGLLLLPGMEITTREEVHMLGYFPTVAAALDFGALVKAHLPKKKNKPAFFGNQRVMNSDDEQIDEEDALLIGATDFSLSEAARRVAEYGGVPVPAQPRGQRLAGQPGADAGGAPFPHGGGMAAAALRRKRPGRTPRAALLRRPLPGRYPGKGARAAPRAPQRGRAAGLDALQKGKIATNFIIRHKKYRFIDKNR